jgi:hypothetical protein
MQFWIHIKVNIMNYRKILSAVLKYLLVFMIVSTSLIARQGINRVERL